MKRRETRKIGYQYVNGHYMSDQQLCHYTKRVYDKGISEAEEVFLNYYADKKDSILDVGTGCGRFAISAFEQGFKNIAAIDMNSRFIQKAKDISKHRKCNIKFSIQNAERTTFENASFDFAIFTSDGFSQVPGNDNKLSVLNEIYRVMKPGGVFILAVIDEQLVKENDSHFYELIQKFRESQSWKLKNFYDENDIAIFDGGYMHFATIDETEGLINKSGFKLLYNATAKDVIGRNDKISSNISRFFVLRKATY